MRKRIATVAIFVCAVSAGCSAPTSTVPSTEPSTEPSAEPSTEGYEPPRTVIFVPGYGGDNPGTSSSTDLAESLASASGDIRVKILDTGKEQGDIHQYARQLQQLTEESEGPVAWVGYSMGGVIARDAYTAKMFPYVSSVTTWGSPHRGTDVFSALAAFGQPCTLGCEQMKPGSEVIRHLNPVENTPATWLSLYSTDDGIVTPVSASEIPVADNAVNINVSECSPPGKINHLQLTGNDNVVRLTVANIMGNLPTEC